MGPKTLKNVSPKNAGKLSVFRDAFDTKTNCVLYERL
jgi:hypothetical protein